MAAAFLFPESMMISLGNTSVVSFTGLFGGVD